MTDDKDYQAWLDKIIAEREAEENKREAEKKAKSRLRRVFYMLPEGVKEEEED